MSTLLFDLALLSSVSLLSFKKEGKKEGKKQGGMKGRKERRKADRQKAEAEFWGSLSPEGLSRVWSPVAQSFQRCVLWCHRLGKPEPQCAADLFPLWPLSLATACLQPVCPAACGCPGACMCVRQAALTIPQMTGLFAHKAGLWLVVPSWVWFGQPALSIHLTLVRGRLISSQAFHMPKASSDAILS